MSDYRLADLVDMSHIQRLADSNLQASGLPMTIIDAVDNSLLVRAGWQDICLKFHRAHPRSEKRCIASEAQVYDRIVEGGAVQYRCQNGLWHIAMPIMVAGRHLGTMFLSQFLIEGEVPQREFFIKQAREFGYDLQAYLAALDRLPVLSLEKVNYIIAYDKALVRFIADLAEQSLRTRQAKESLRQSERLAAIGKMAAHISHEIKNPLIVIGGFARQVLKDSAQDPQKNLEKLRIIVDEVKRLEDFLIEVGSYAKFSEPHKELGDLNALIKETCLRLEPSLHESNIGLSLALDPDLPQVQFDPIHLRQVILNIAKNGLEAMEAGGTLTITTGRQEGRIFVQISDTGPGIPQEVRAKLFEPFFSTKPKGSGLGLAISQKIVDAHQGKIAIESELQKGTRVTIFLKA